jgi:hypothetical protein
VQTPPTESLRRRRRSCVEISRARGTIWVSCSSEDTEHIIATAQGAAVETIDGGAQWKPLDIPDGVSIVEVSPHGPDVLYGVSL